MYARIQYITGNHPDKSHSRLCLEACESGIRWIQLRMKEVTVKEYLAEAKKCREITDQYGATLIVNDNIEVTLASRADGVHLGQSDLEVSEARKIIGNNLLIGATANTFEHITDHLNNGADYVGAGPFRFTETKKKLSPVLGLEGYRYLLGKLKRVHINIPVIAIGGIVLEDISPLIKTGVHGVAVSGLITNASNKLDIVNYINNKLKCNHLK